MKLLATLAISQVSASFYDALFADYNYELEFDLEAGNDCYAYAGFTPEMQIQCTLSEVTKKVVRRKDDGTPYLQCFCKYDPKKTVDNDFEDPDASIEDTLSVLNLMMSGAPELPLLGDKAIELEPPKLPTFDLSLLVGGTGMRSTFDEEPIIDDSQFDEPVGDDFGIFKPVAIAVDPVIEKKAYINQFVTNGIVSFPLPSLFKSCYDFLKFPGNKAIQCKSQTFIGHSSKVCVCSNPRMMKNARELKLVPDDAQDITEELKEFLKEKAFVLERMTNLLDDNYVEPYEEPQPYEFEIHASFVENDKDTDEEYCQKQKKKQCKMLPKCTWQNHKATVEKCAATCTDLLKNAKEIAGDQCRDLMVKIDVENQKELVCQRSRRINYNLCFETLNNFLK